MDEFPCSIAAGRSSSLFIDNEGKVRASGSNIQGQLGLKEHKLRTTPQVIKLPSKILAVSCTTHSLFLDGEGTVWSCGDNSHMQLGQMDNNKFEKVTGFDLPIVSVSAGYGYSLFLDEAGKVWKCGIDDSKFGYNEKILRMVVIEGLPKIQFISAGNTFSGFLDTEGKLWFTKPAKGPTAFPLENDWVPPFKFISTYFEGIYLIDTEGNAWHVAIVNSEEQKAERVFPTLKHIKMISSQINSTLILLQNGSVYGIGENKYGQLGFSCAKEKSDFIIDVPKSDDCKKKAKGREVKIPSFDENGYPSGKKEDDEYEDNDSEDDDKAIIKVSTAQFCAKDPVKIEGIPEIIYVSISYQHAILLDKSGEIWVTGRNSYGQLGLGDFHHRYGPIKNKHMPLTKTKFGLQYKVRVAAPN